MEVEHRSRASWNPSAALFWTALVVSGAFKLLRLRSRELWLDETYSAHVASGSWGQILHDSTGDLHPPLYHLLLHLWTLLAGNAESHLRLFSVLINLACIAGVYLLARRALAPAFAGLSAALFAFSPMLFVYSLEVRSYMLLVLLTVVTLNLHWQVVIQRAGTKWTLLRYGVVLALLFYVHYLSLFILLALVSHAVYAAFSRRELFARIGIVAATALLLMSPGLYLIHVQRANSAAARQQLAVAQENPNALIYHSAALLGKEDVKKRSEVAKDAAVLIGFFPARHAALFALCALPLLCALLGIAYLGLARGDLVCRMLLLVTVFLAAGLIVFHAYGTRYLLPLAPLLALALARVVQAVTQRRRAAGLALGGLLLLIYFAGFIRQATHTHGRPWEDVIAALQTHYRPGDQVVFDAAYGQIPFDYFAGQAGFHPAETGYPESTYQWWNEQHEVTGWGGPVILQSDLDRYVQTLASSRHTAWIVHFESRYSDPHDQLVQRLATSGRLDDIALPADPDIRDEDSSEVRLLRFTPAALSAPAVQH